MGFDDIARRMRDERGTSRWDGVHAVWHGESVHGEPVLEAAPPVAPEARARTSAIAYTLFTLGLLIAFGGGIALLFLHDEWSRNTVRITFGVVVLGMLFVAKAIPMFKATAPRD